jgi:argininosuccinate lyase
MYRMQQRQLILAVIEGTLALRNALILLADTYRDAVFAAHTHTQPAQPSTVAHYLQAAIEQLERDTVRLEAAYASTNQNPLGACAITGTGFPIDRSRTTELLGFDGTTCNTYGSIATVDYLLESVSATAVMLVGLGRVVQDLLLWCTSEFGYPARRRVRAGQQHHAAEAEPRGAGTRARDRCKALGQAARTDARHAHTPFGDIVDTEDDLQPLVASMFKDAARRLARRGGDDRRDVRRREAGRTRRAGVDHHHGAGGYARARSRPRVQGRAHDRIAPDRRIAREPGEADGGDAAGRRRT